MKFKKSSFSVDNGSCVEVAEGKCGVQVRDSKDPEGSVLEFTKDQWSAFVDGAKNGEFDLNNATLEVRCGEHLSLDLSALVPVQVATALPPVVPGSGRTSDEAAGPVKLSASIMAHPAREDQVNELRSLLDRPVPVHWDDEGPPSGSADRVWRTARGAWLLADPAADWHALIQDDALPCADLLAGLERALEHVPEDCVVSAYLGTGRTVPIRWEALARAADSAGASWVRTQKLMWGVCVILPVRLIPEMIERANRRAGVPDDMRVAGWAEKTGREVWYPWPSLVDHRKVPSLTKHRAHDRVARRWHRGSALDLSWSGSVVTDPMLARRRADRSGPTRLRA